ncbi:MAG: SagB/ThcOx family dehydrogenase [candidate division Zixibacteria bacterium]
MRIKCVILTVVFISLSGLTAADKSDSLSIGPQFHLETSFGASGIKGDNISFGTTIPLYKTYNDANKTKLATPGNIDFQLINAIESRKSIRKFDTGELTFKEISTILLTADGITHERNGIAMRSAPSGGALYPIEIYLYAHAINSLEQGLYHFQVSDSSLEFIKSGDFNADFHEFANNQNSVGASPATIILTARFDRSTRKYADRGYRYTYMEGGAICQNIYLACTALNLGTVSVGAFDDDRLNEFLAVDGLHEAALLIFPIGRPTP